jgi:phage terminase large subunit-like protein
MSSFKLTARQEIANQLLGGKAKHVLLRGGSRSGKTFLIVRAICLRAMKYKNSRHAMLRFRANAAKSSLWLDTLPKVMRLCWPHIKLKWHKQDGYIQFPNGSEVWIGGLQDQEQAEKILGMEFGTIYYNECTQIPYGSVLLARTRLAQQIAGMVPKEYYDCNPSGTGHYTYKLWKEHRDPESHHPIDVADYAEMQLNPYDNTANIASDYIKILESLPEKQKRRFLSGEWSPDIEGALWTLDVLDRCRILVPDQAHFEHILKMGSIPQLKRVIVAVDPSGCQGREDRRSDEIGISVCGLGSDGHTYVMSDKSLRDGPEGWARAAINAFHEYKADCIVAETNYGGAMVEHTIKTADPNVPVKVIHASRGKVVRAEPVSALYEQGKVHHVGTFHKLEEQMINMAASGYVGQRSPDRMDALVWAVSELMLGGEMKGKALWDLAMKDMADRQTSVIPMHQRSYAVGSVEWQRQQLEQVGGTVQ